MKVSSAYICEALMKVFDTVQSFEISAYDSYSRPFFHENHEGHICINPSNPMDGVLAVFCGEKTNDPIEQKWNNHPRILLPEKELPVFNLLQQAFDRADEWEREVDHLILQQAGVERLIPYCQKFFINPRTVMGMDFAIVAESGAELLPEKARLFSKDRPNELNVDIMNTLLQDKIFQKMAITKQVLLLPEYITGCRSLNRCLFIEEQASYRLILTECQEKLTDGNVCVLEALSVRLEYLLSLETKKENSGVLEAIFRQVLTDRTADYIKISQQLTATGWGKDHRYLCMILQVTYLNQKQLSPKALCRHLKTEFLDSVSFLHKDEVVTFFNLTKLNLNEEEVATKLVFFIRDTYLKAGYSRAMTGHANLRRQYVQARTALDVGSRKKPYLWIHHFNQVALTYLMEQSTRRLPAYMICLEGILRLQELDLRGHSDYVQTFKTYLENHLSATSTANALFIHRSTFLYRLEKIKEILSSDLEDRDELFYLELSLRLLDQEKEQMN